LHPFIIYTILHPFIIVSIRDDIPNGHPASKSSKSHPFSASVLRFTLDVANTHGIAVIIAAATDLRENPPWKAGESMGISIHCHIAMFHEGKPNKTCWETSNWKNENRNPTHIP